MRHFKIAAVLAMAALAVSATPALAHEFISSGGPTKGKGEEQYFQLGPFHISCAKAVSTGTTAAGSSSTLGTETKLRQCTTEAKLGGEPIFLRTRFLDPVVTEYHANGFVEIGAEGEEVEGNTTLKGGTIEMKITGIKCVIKLPEQTIPRSAIAKPNGEFEAATYNTEEFMRGKTPFHKIAISNEWKGIHFEYGEGQCSTFKTSEEERKSGKFVGEMLEEVVKGNLEFQ